MKKYFLPVIASAFGIIVCIACSKGSAAAGTARVTGSATVQDEFYK